MNDLNTPIDIDSLSDEEFMKLDPSQMQEVAAKVETPVIEETSDLKDNLDGNENSNPDDDTNKSDDSDPKDIKSNDPEKSENSDSEKQKQDTNKEQEKEKAIVPPQGSNEKPTDPNPDTKPETKTEKKADDNVKSEKIDTKSAVDFFEKVSAPFKADGKDMQVRTAEDVVRLMQMGVNYSRRMQEMKPLRAQDQMLKANGLNDPEKLNYLIDLSKGNKDAIKKLLKDNNIDPVDIDTTSEDKPYLAKNYQVDPKDLAFDDAIKETIAAEGGRELITDINKDWDNVSKEALRDQPAIFQNMLAQKRSGVYLKIQEELKYQRTMGFLTDVPFLQAYHQVGEAMQKAGVFGSTTTEDQPTKIVVGTGTRKDALKPNTEQPTPNISSASPPRSASANAGGQHKEPDYSAMSDEEFKKLAPPS